MHKIDWWARRYQLTGAALATCAVCFSLYSNFHCSFASSGTLLLGIFTSTIRGDDCHAYDDDLYTDIDVYWHIAQLASVTAVVLGVVAMNLVWCTIMYNTFQQLVIRLLVCACLCEALLFLLFISSLCTNHNFSCQGGVGSQLCICACVLWALSAILLRKGRAIHIQTQGSNGGGEGQQYQQQYKASKSNKVIGGDENASTSTFGENRTVP